jgi:hypothetical protein
MRLYSHDLNAAKATYLVSVRYLGMLENIFIVDGQPGHEIIMFLQADLADETLYTRDDLIAVEDDLRVLIAWERLDDVTDQTPLYPAGLGDLFSGTRETPRYDCRSGRSLSPAGSSSISARR